MTKKSSPPEEYEIEDGEIIRRAFTCDTVKAIDKEKRLIDFAISTERVDRMGDVITVSGWKLKEFRRNPVILFGHNSRQPPIGRAIKVGKTDSALTATAQFMERDLNEFADSVYRMYLEGFMRAVSVGFIPLARERIEDDDGDFTGFKFTKQELLEFSAVPIPANPDALINARSAGIDTQPFRKWAEEILDKWGDEVEPLHLDIYGLSKNNVEDIYRDASDPKETVNLHKSDEGKGMLENLKVVSKAIQGKVENLVLETISDGEDEPIVEILEAPDYTAFTRELCEQSEWIDITQEDDKSPCLLKLTVSNGEAEYKIVGKDKEDNLVGKLVVVDLKTIALTEQQDTPEDEDEAESSEEESGVKKLERVAAELAATEAAELAATEAADEETELAKVALAALRDPDDEGKKDDDDDDDDREMSIGFALELLDRFEKFLDKNESDNHTYTKQDLRKFRFLVIYLEETTDRLKDICDITPEEGRSSKAKPPSNGHDSEKKFVKLTDVQKMLDESLPTRIEKLVDKRISQIQGRLD